MREAVRRPFGHWHYRYAGAGLFDPLVEHALLRYASPNRPKARDGRGTVTLRPMRA